MDDFLLILLSTILVNNFVLVQLLGLCPFMGVSSRLEMATSMAFTTTFVLTLASVANWLIYHMLLKPAGLEYLRIIAFMLVIAGLVQFTKLLVKRMRPLLYRILGMFLPLITTNCVILGVTLLHITVAPTLVEATLYGAGAAIGFSLAMILFAALRERVATADVPDPFRGPAISMITAGSMSLAYMGFAGLV